MVGILLEWENIGQGAEPTSEQFHPQPNNLVAIGFVTVGEGTADSHVVVVEMDEVFECFFVAVFACCRVADLNGDYLRRSARFS